ncbi:MAG: YceD family protein [Acidimicrobiia bacterium]
MSALRIDVADLLTHPGARRPLHVEAVITGLGGAAARIREPVTLDLVLERVPEGIVARGTVLARWESECSVCLCDLSADLDAGVAELYEAVPVDGETYPIEGHELDLEQLVRDAVLLELPLAPSCAGTGRERCQPVAAPVAGDRPPDPRWAALSELEL